LGEQAEQGEQKSQAKYQWTLNIPRGWW